MIPQIEHCLRRLLSLLGQPTNKPVKGFRGIMQEQNINDVLAKPVIRNVIPEDMRLYMMVVLAEQRGLNIRNRVSHGLMSKSDFDQRNSDLILNILLCLGGFKIIEKTSDSNETETRYEPEK